VPIGGAAVLLRRRIRRDDAAGKRPNFTGGSLDVQTITLERGASAIQPAGEQRNHPLFHFMSTP
jgi:hypothetical protein